VLKNTKKREKNKSHGQTRKKVYNPNNPNNPNNNPNNPELFIVVDD